MSKKVGFFPGQLVELLGETSFDGMKFAVVSKVLDDGQIVLRSINNRWRKNDDQSSYRSWIKNVREFPIRQIKPVEEWSMSPAKYCRVSAYSRRTETRLFKQFQDERLKTGKLIGGGFIVIGMLRAEELGSSSVKILVQRPGKVQQTLWYPCWCYRLQKTPEDSGVCSFN